MDLRKNIKSVELQMATVEWPSTNVCFQIALSFPEGDDEGASRSMSRLLQTI